MFTVYCFLVLFLYTLFFIVHICIKNKKQKQHQTTQTTKNKTMWGQKYVSEATSIHSQQKQQQQQKEKKKDNNSGKDDICTVHCWLHLMCVCLSLMLLSKVCLPCRTDVYFKHVQIHAHQSFLCLLPAWIEYRFDLASHFYHKQTAR